MNPKANSFFIFFIIYIIQNISWYYIFQRINSILGYPTIIIKQIKTNVKNPNEISNSSAEETKENEEEDNNKKEKKKYWPLFGERLIMEENENNPKIDLSSKLKKYIYKYIGVNHKKQTYCLLSLLFSQEEENGNIMGQEINLENFRKF